MTNGWGQMPSYSTQIPVEDRWAIAAYIRALQLSQNFQYSKLTSEERNQLEETPKKESNAHGH
jgi:mono/diheme cytochrome c family protein